QTSGHTDSHLSTAFNSPSVGDTGDSNNNPNAFSPAGAYDPSRQSINNFRPVIDAYSMLSSITSVRLPRPALPFTSKYLSLSVPIPIPTTHHAPTTPAPAPPPCTPPPTPAPKTAPAATAATPASPPPTPSPSPDAAPPTPAAQTPPAPASP